MPGDISNCQQSINHISSSATASPTGALHECCSQLTVVGNTAVRLPGVKTEKIMTFKSPRMDAGHETIYLLSPRAASSLV